MFLSTESRDFLEINKKAINDFIYKVFNYYNGKINYFNKAILDIDWAELNSISNAGTTRNPNLVTIFPKVIMRYNQQYDIFNFYYAIIYTIIHELYHIDQIIDYIKMKNDIKYMEYIERAVETQTVIYISNHIKEISDNFGIEIYDNNSYFSNEIAYWNNGYSYFRRKYDDHLIILLNEIIANAINTKPLFDAIRYNILTNTGKISITINDFKILIQSDGILINVDDINRMLYEHYFKYDYRYRTNVDINIQNKNNTNDINIIINTDLKLVMVKYGGKI